MTGPAAATRAPITTKSLQFARYVGACQPSAIAGRRLAVALGRMDVNPRAGQTDRRCQPGTRRAAPGLDTASMQGTAKLPGTRHDSQPAMAAAPAAPAAAPNRRATNQAASLQPPTRSTPPTSRPAAAPGSQPGRRSSSAPAARRQCCGRPGQRQQQQQRPQQQHQQQRAQGAAAAASARPPGPLLAGHKTPLRHGSNAGHHSHGLLHPAARRGHASAAVSNRLHGRWVRAPPPAAAAAPQLPSCTPALACTAATAARQSQALTCRSLGLAQRSMGRFRVPTPLLPAPCSAAVQASAWCGRCTARPPSCQPPCLIWASAPTSTRASSWRLCSCCPSTSCRRCKCAGRSGCKRRARRGKGWVHPMLPRCAVHPSGRSWQL